MQNKLKINNFLKIIVTLQSILVLTGCNKDLNEVAKFGGTSDQLKTALSSLADDIYFSCIRTANYIPLANSREKVNYLENCDNQNKVESATLKKANLIVINYVQTLGNVAGNEKIPLDTSVNNIGSALEGVTISTSTLTSTPTSVSLKSDAVKQGVAVANFLNNLFITGIRRSSVKKAIICTNSSFQTYGQGLESIYSEGLVNGLLKNETGAINDYYKRYYDKLTIRNPSPFDNLKLDSEYNNALEQVSNRKRSAEDSMSVLENTISTDNQLRNMFVEEEKLNEQEVTNFCQSYLKSLDKSKRSESADLNFRINNDMSPREKLLAAEIVTNYQKEIMPKIKEIRLYRLNYATRNR